MTRLETQVVILGGGCGGLWLLFELSRNSIQALLVEHMSLGRYASTRNQSWLHTGALYGVILSELGTEDEGLRTTARACRSSFAEIREFCSRSCPDSLEHSSECLFLFNDKMGVARAQDELRRLGIWSELLNQAEVERLEPVLSPTALLHYGLKTEDKPFDSHRILAALMHEASALGGRFYGSRCELAQLQISNDGHAWVVRDSTTEVTAPVLVCSSGALIPKMLSTIQGQTGMEYGIEVQKCVVAVLHHRICQRILVIRDRESNWLNLVPFTGGTTVNMGLVDESPAEVNDVEVPLSLYPEFVEKLRLFVPGMIRSVACGVHFYVCQKIRNTERSSHPARSFGFRHYFWVPAGNNAFAFYPGKFTLAPLAARNFVRSLLDTSVIAPIGKKILRQEGTLPAIARRPYYEEVTHVIGLTRARRLELEEIRG